MTEEIPATWAATHSIKGVRGHPSHHPHPAIQPSPAPITPGFSRTDPLRVNGESLLWRETDLGPLPAPSLDVK